MSDLKLIAEITPSHKESFWSRVEEIIKYVDILDIPESPLGVPKPNSVAVSSIISIKYGVPVIAHIRVMDVNRVSLLSLCHVAKLTGVYGILLTRGDKTGGESKLTTEDAVKVIRDDNICSSNPIKLGSVLSFRYPMSMIIERINGSYDFFLSIIPKGLNLSVIEEAKIYSNARGKEIYTYMIIRTERNRDIVDNLNQMYIDLNDIDKVIENFKRYSNGVLVSCPRDFRCLVEAIKIIRDTV